MANARGALGRLVPATRLLPHPGRSGPRCWGPLGGSRGPLHRTLAAGLPGPRSLGAPRRFRPPGCACVSTPVSRPPAHPSLKGLEDGLSAAGAAFSGRAQAGRVLGCRRHLAGGEAAVRPQDLSRSSRFRAGAVGLAAPRQEAAEPVAVRNLGFLTGRQACSRHRGLCMREASRHGRPCMRKS